MSDYVEALADTMEDTIEVVSSEHLVSRFNKYNEELEKSKAAQNDDMKGKAVITGADAVSLFPSLLVAHTARQVRDAAMESKLQVEGMDYKEMARYVVMGYEPWEVFEMKLGRIVPHRRYKKGTKPGVTGIEPLKKEAGDEI